MVGIAGGSKGCKTCRQRRVKCTEEKPACSRCARGGFVCHGYARETAWHNLTTQSSSDEGSAEAMRTTLGRLVVTESQSLEIREARGTAARSLVSPPPPPTQISLAGFQEDLCFAYIFSNFVWRGYGASWLHQSAQGLLGQLAFDSVTALAEINFGKSQKSQRTEIQGRLKYGKALRCMIGRLEAQRKNDLAELVVPILVLLMHTTTLTNRPAAMFHLQAMTQILAACGPQKFQHQPLRDAFEAARATMVVASLVICKRTFLDSPAWHEGPYALMPHCKAPQSYLLDILTSVPRLLEDYSEYERMVQANTAHNTHARSSFDGENIEAFQRGLVHRVIAQLESLFAWRLHWQVAFGSHVYGEPVIRGSTAEPYISRLYFSSSIAASDIALYNAVFVWLLSFISELEPLRADCIVQDCAYQAMLSMPKTQFSFTSKQKAVLTGIPAFEPLSGIGSTTKIRDAALEICRVFQWQSGNHASAATWEANFVYMFPISLALCVFDTDPEKRAWIRAMLDANALTRNYGVAHSLGDGSLQNRSDRVSSLLDSDVGVGTAAAPNTEKGMLCRLQRFGWFVTRELADDKHVQEVPDPNLVHLLLLRGRADIPS